MSAYHEIRAGETGVTIITEGRTVWVAATVGGKCRSAFGMYHGPVRSLLTGEDLDTPRRWRPCYWRIGTRNAYGDYVHMWWTWLSCIGRFETCVGLFDDRKVAMGLLEALEASAWLKERKAGLHSPSSVLSEGEWPLLMVEDHAGRDYPRNRPRYE